MAWVPQRVQYLFVFTLFWPFICHKTWVPSWNPRNPIAISFQPSFPTSLRTGLEHGSRTIPPGVAEAPKLHGLEPSHTWTNFRNISLPCSDEDFFVCEKDSFQFPTPGKNVGIIKHRNILLLRGLDILTLDSRLAAIEESKAGRSWSIPRGTWQ